MPGRGYTVTVIADVGSLTGLNNSDVDPKGEGAVLHVFQVTSQIICLKTSFSVWEFWGYIPIYPKNHGFENILHMSKFVYSCTNSGGLQSL